MPVLLPKHFQENVENNLKTKLLSTQVVHGGSINQAQLLQSTQGLFFIKYNTTPNALDMFQQEAKGLKLLQDSDAGKVPQVCAVDQSENIAYLVLEYITTGEKTKMASENLGRALAKLHRQTALQFGLDHDNYIGTLAQSNTYWDTWADFYQAQRLMPQMEIARNSERLSPSDAKHLEKLCTELPNLCPIEFPSLIHGDLWAGNYMVTPQDQPVWIDPAVSYSHREMDLAMSRLFGGFDPLFYKAYEAAFPLENGFEERLEIYQLYYLLVHVNLFGGSYIDSVRRILEKF